MTTARIIVLADTTEASAKLDELAVKSDATGTAISDAGKKAGSDFSSAMSDATNKSGGFLSKLSGEMSNLGIPGAQSIGKFGDALAQADSKGAALSQTMNEIGKAALKGGLAAFAIAAYEGVKGAMALQKQMEMIHTQAGASTAEVKRMTDAVLGMAASVGQGPLQLAQALYHVESVGLRGAKALAVLKTSAEGAAIGGANLTDVTNALDAAVVSGIAGAHNYKAAMGELNATVGAGDMTMQDLADAMGIGLLATAKTYGLTISQVGGALATFGDNNLRGAAAATRLRQVIMTMAAPSKAASEALFAIGLSQTQLASDMKSGGLVKALADLQVHLKASGATAQQQGLILSRAFGGGKTSSGVLLLMQELSRLEQKTAAVAHGGTRFGADWNATTKTLAFQFEQLKAGASALVDKLGMDLIPIIEKMGQFVAANRGAFMDFAEIIGGVLTAAVLKYSASTANKFLQATAQMASKVLNLGASSTATAAETQAANATITESTVQTFGVQSETSAATIASLQRQAEEYTLMAAECRDAAIVVTEAGITIDEDMAKMSVEAETLASQFRAQMTIASESVDALATSTTAAASTAETAMGGMAAEATTSAGIFDTALGSTGVGLVIIGLGVAVTELATHWKTVWPEMANVAAEVANNINHGLNTIVSTAEHVANAILDVVNAFGAGIKKINVQDNTLSTSLQSLATSNPNAKGNYAINTKTSSDTVRNITAAEAQEIQSLVNQGKSLVAAIKEAKSNNGAGFGSGASTHQFTPGTPVSMGQLEQLWIQKGGNAALAPTMAGIAEYESGGGYMGAQYPGKHTPVNTQNATGLWQIMPSNYPGLEAQGAVPTAKTPWDVINHLIRPGVNASAAVALAGGAGHTGVSGIESNWAGDPIEQLLAKNGGKPLTQAQVQAALGHIGINYGSTATGGAAGQISSALATYLGSQSGSAGVSTAITPRDIMMENEASLMRGSMSAASKVPTTLVGQQSSLSKLVAAISQDRNAPELAKQMRATKNPTMSRMAAQLEAEWAGLTSKLATIVNTDTQTGMSTLSSLSSAATNDNLTTLRTDMTAAFKAKLDVLVNDLNVVNKGMAGEIQRQYHAVAMQLKEVQKYDARTKQGQVEQNRATTTQAVAQKMSDAAAAMVTKITDMQTKSNDASTAMVTKITDMATVSKDASSAMVTHIQDVATAAQNAAQNQTTIIQAKATLSADAMQSQASIVQAQAQLQSDTINAMATQVTDAAQQMADAINAQSQAVQDATQMQKDAAAAQAQSITDQATVQSATLNERGKWGLNLVAQQAQVALDVQQQTDHVQEAAAQAHLDQVTTQQHQMTALAQQKLDQVTTQTAAMTALGQEKADTVAITTQQTIAAAQAKADAIALKEAQLVAKAQAHADSVTLASAGKMAAAQSHLDQTNLGAAAKVASATAHVDAVAIQESVKVAAAQAKADSVYIAQSNAQTAASIAEAIAQFLHMNKQLSAQSTLALVQGHAAAAEASANAVVAQVQASANQANANAKRNLDNVTNSTNRAIATATTNLNNVTNSTNRANATAQAILGTVQNTAAVANATAQSQLSTAQATAAQQQAASQAALSQLQANGALQQAQAQAALSQAQATSNLQISVAQQQLAAVNNAATVEEAKLQGIYTVDEALAQTQYAGSGIAINIVNQGGGNAQEIADAVGWELRTRIA